MAEKECSRDAVLRELKKIALSRPNAGIELAYMENPTRQMIQRLDLSALSEFRRNSAGTVELRFIDRVREYYFDSRREGRQKTDAEYMRDLKKFTASAAWRTVICSHRPAMYPSVRHGFLFWEQ